MLNNFAKAVFITSLGSLNNYGSTVLQTKLALDTQSTAPLRQDKDDTAIFTDALNGIEAIKKIGFSADGIIAINRTFTSESDEQPAMPGHLRNAYYNDDDKIAIVVDEKLNEAYFPPEIISKEMLDEIVNKFKNSARLEIDAGRVFVGLSKLQPFQDGNKRTALIFANSAIGALDTEKYLTLPFNQLDKNDFDNALMRYYIANTAEQETKSFEKLISTLPSIEERAVKFQSIDDLKNFRELDTSKYVVKNHHRKQIRQTTNQFMRVVCLIFMY